MTEHNEPRWRDPLASGFVTVPKSEAEQAVAQGWHVIGPVHGSDRIFLHRPAPLHTLRSRPHGVGLE